MNSAWFTLNVGDYSVDSNRVIHKHPCYMREGLCQTTFSDFKKGITEEDRNQLEWLFHKALREIDKHIRRQNDDGRKSKIG